MSASTSEIVNVHHLDCATMCPRVAINDGSTIPGHVLLIETKFSGLVLVDTGFGTAARANPKAQLGGLFTMISRPETNPATTALHQVKRLGFDPTDVRHILITHLDLDHAGGLADFPHATVHLHADELAAAQKPTWREKTRYRAPLWAHQPKWSTFTNSGESWNGFDAAKPLPGLPSEIVALPLPGHTRGHVAFAVETPATTLVHAGDAYFHRGVVTGEPVHKRSVTMEKLNAVNYKQVLANHLKLAELAARKSGDSGNDSQRAFTVFCAHDPIEFAQLSS